MAPKVTQKPYAANQILVAKLTYDRYPGQSVYCIDLAELHQVLDSVFIDDPDRFKTKPDYDFNDWMNAGEQIRIEMEYVSQEFIDKLEDFEVFG
jgi:hypothetical protein